MKLIAKTGAISFDQAQQIYKTKNYHYHRLIALEKAGYITKTGHYIRLTSKGAKEVGGSTARISPYMLNRYNIYAELILSLPYYEAVPQKYLKSQFKLNNRTHFQGGLKLNDKIYFVYILPEGMTRTKIGQIKSELDFLGHLSKTEPNIQGAVLVALSPSELHKFPVAAYDLDVFLLPYDATTITLLNSWARPEYHEYLASLVPKPCIPSNRPFAHYETAQAYYTFLMTNNLAVRYRLNAYFQAQPDGNPVHIFCLEEQKDYFQSQYPYAFVHVVEIEPKLNQYSFGGGGL